jgi:hypothetical protein
MLPAIFWTVFHVIIEVSVIRVYRLVCYLTNDLRISYNVCHALYIQRRCKKVGSKAACAQERWLVLCVRENNSENCYINMYVRRFEEG